MKMANAKVLLLDDEVSVLSAFKRLLHKENIDLITCENPHKALQLAKDQTFAMVISDRFMPEMDGISFLNEIKSESPETLRVMLTGSADVNTAINAINIGEVYRFILKPWVDSEVIFTIKEGVGLFNLKEEVKRLNAELKSSYTQLQELESHKEMLVNMIVHDIRSPLMITENVMYACQSHLSEQKAHNSAIEEIIHIGLESISQTLLLANSLLDLSRLEQGKMDIHFKICDVEAIFKDLVRSYAPLCQREGKLISYESSIQSPKCLADESIVIRVLQNLITNAIKFTDTGDSIKLGVNSIEKGVNMCVSDTGPGIPEHKLSSIFDKYVQAGVKETEKASGVGLGLAFCKMGVEAMNGSIGVTSKLGEGTCFNIVLESE